MGKDGARDPFLRGLPMNSVRLALGMAIGLTLSAAAWALVNEPHGDQTVEVQPSGAQGLLGPEGAPLSGGRDGLGRDAGVPTTTGTISATASAGSSGTPSATAGAVVPAPPPAGAPPIQPREPQPSGGSSSASPPPESPAATTGLTATFSISSTWQDGFVGSVRVTNDTDAEQAWEIRLTFPETVTIPDGSQWNASKEGSTGTIIFTGRPVAPGSVQDFGFTATKTVQNRKAFVPTACVVNGVVCEAF